MNVTIRGDVICQVDDDLPVSMRMLRQLHGHGDQTCFSDYFTPKGEFGEHEEALIKKGVSGGYINLVFDKGFLYCETSYSADEELNENELEQLKKFTLGQWSDGVGEGFEQEPIHVDGYEVYVSCWHENQLVTVSQGE